MCRPKNLRAQVSGQEHNDHTIVMHPWLTHHLRVYHLDICDAINGMLFGDSERYTIPWGCSTRAQELSPCTMLTPFHQLLNERYPSS